MSAIFVSYRRDDSEGEAGRLFDDLVNQFGEGSVFMDVAAIELGRDFRKAIDESVTTCGLLLAIIGRNWLDAKNEKGERRLDQENDYVRLETAAALKRDIPVIPVLVRGTSMPRPEDLPDDLKELAYRNGCELSHARWNSDLHVLIKALRVHIDIPEKRPQQTVHVNQQVAAAQPTPVPLPKAVISETPQAKSRWPVYIFALAAVLAAVLLAYVYQWSTIPTDQATMKNPAAVKPDDAQASQEIEVPTLIGLSQENAEKTIRSLRLVVGSVTKRQNVSANASTIIRQFPTPPSRVKPGTAIDLVVADRPVRTAEPDKAAVAAPEPPRTSSTSLPDFRGPWLLFEVTFNGVREEVANPKPISYAQDGDTVEIGKRRAKIMPDRSATYQIFYAKRSGGALRREVDAESEADQVNTFTWRVGFQTLILQVTLYYKEQPGVPSRKDVRMFKYRRVIQ